jgi:hypothetical protein
MLLKIIFGYEGTLVMILYFLICIFGKGYFKQAVLRRTNHLLSFDITKTQMKITPRKFLHCLGNGDIFFLGVA